MIKRGRSNNLPPQGNQSIFVLICKGCNQRKRGNTFAVCVCVLCGEGEVDSFLLLDVMTCASPFRLFYVRIVSVFVSVIETFSSFYSITIRGMGGVDMSWGPVNMPFTFLSKYDTFPLDNCNFSSRCGGLP